MTKKESYYPGKKTKLLLITIFFILFIITTLPFGIQYGLQYWLKKEVGNSVTINDVDFNLFTLKAVIKQLSFQNTGSDNFELFNLDLSVKKLLDKKIEVSDLDLDGLDLTIRQSEKQIEIAGFNLKQKVDKKIDNEDKHKQPWQWGINQVEINDTRITLIKDKHSINFEIKHLLLEDLHSNAPEKNTRIILTGKIAGRPISVNGSFSGVGQTIKLTADTKIEQLSINQLKPWIGELPIINAVISANTQLKASVSPDNQISFNQQGKLSIDELDFKKQLLSSKVNQLSWDGSLSVNFLSENNMTLNQKGKLLANKIQYNDGLLTSSVDSFSWNGDVNTEIKKNKKVTLSGTLDIFKPELILGHNAFVVTLQQFSSQQKSQFSLDSFSESLTYNGDILLEKLKIDSPVKEVNWIQLNTLQAQNTGITGLNKISIDQLELNDYAVGRERKNKEEIALLKTKKSHLEKLIVNNLNEIYVKKVFHDNLHSRLERKNDGELRAVGLFSLIAELNKTIKTAVEQQPVSDNKIDTASSKPKIESIKDKTEKPSENSFKLQLDDFHVSSGSSISFVDYSVKPVYKTRLDIERFTWKGFDTHSIKPGKVQLKGKVDEFSDLNIVSEVRFHNKMAHFDSNIEIKSLPLPPISSYSTSSSGYAITSGQLDADIKVQSEESKLNGNMKVDIHKLNMTETDTEKVSKGEHKNSDMSLAMALDLLRDKNDNISLTIPITGDLDNPEFGIQDIINKAAISAAKKGAMTYLTTALQPYGALISIAQYAGENISKIRLKPIEFTAGDRQLSSQASDYLSKIADVLKQREKLEIKVCAFATQADRDELAQQQYTKRKVKERSLTLKQVTVSDEDIREIALSRAQIVQKVLIKNHNIKPERLINCLPATDKDTKGTPRVELLL